MKSKKETTDTEKKDSEAGLHEEHRRVIFLRYGSDDSIARGEPCGALAYEVLPGERVDVAFALCHGEKDRWDKALSRSIALGRLNKRRSGDPLASDRMFFSVPLSTSEKVMPYDVLRLVNTRLGADSAGGGPAISRLQRIVRRMLIDRDRREATIARLIRRAEACGKVKIVSSGGPKAKAKRAR